MTIKNTQLACLRIGYQNYLMPMTSALKVAELMASAVCCEKQYDDGYTYTPTVPAEIEFELVPPSRITMPMPATATPKRSTSPKLIKG